MARVGGTLRGLPRNVDVRLLHYRTDLISTPPQTWNELFDVASQRLFQPPELFGFGVFPGQRIETSSCTFYSNWLKWAERICFPRMESPRSTMKAGDGLTCQCSVRGRGNCTRRDSPVSLRRGPSLLPRRKGGHGRAIGPDIFAACNDSASISTGRGSGFAVCPYPTGPTGRSLAYGGSHTFALTHRGADNPAAVEMLRILTSCPKSVVRSVDQGSVPVRRSVMKQMQASGASRGASARWKALQ